MAEQSNTKRLAKNSLYMYIRQGITLLIALFSSRVLLKTLGVEDYGVYNLVGSIIAMVGMLKGMFAYTTQRFLNIEMGHHNFDRLHLIFSMSMIINMLTALIFVIIVEAIGLWFFEYKINIDPTRLLAAKWVFHLSVFSSVIVILTSPYDATLIANERFSFYAFISVLEATLKLLAILAIPLLKGDNLIIYGVLLLIVSLLIRMINGFYCSKSFKECHFKLCWDKATFREMLDFSWWQLLGNTAFSLAQNGMNMVFNVFGGPVVNAARGVSYQVYGAVRQFLTNIVSAIRPYSIKAYAEGYDEKVQRMFFFSSKALFLASFIITVPLIYMAEFILQIWLGTVPMYAVGFVQITMLWMLINSVHSPIDTLFMAIGKIKYYQICEGIVLSLPLLASYIILKIGLSYYWAMSSLILFEIVNLFCILYILNKYYKIRLGDYIKIIVFPMLLSIIFGFIGYFFTRAVFNNSLLYSFVVSLIVDIVVIVCFYFMALNNFERNTLYVLVNSIKNKLK